MKVSDKATCVQTLAFLDVSFNIMIISNPLLHIYTCASVCTYIKLGTKLSLHYVNRVLTSDLLAMNT